MTYTDETKDLTVMFDLMSTGSEAEHAYQKAVTLGHVRHDDPIEDVQLELVESTTTEEADVAGKHSISTLSRAAVDMPSYPADAMSVYLAQITKLPDVADGAEEDFGFAPADMLSDLIRIAYPAGIYAVSLWRGLESEREHFVAGRVTGSWRIEEELLIGKSPQGRVTEVNLTEEQERAMLWAGGER